MIIRTIAVLLLAQSLIFGFQSDLKNSPLPAKSKTCSPAEEKWWNDLREKALSITKLSKMLNDADLKYRNNGAQYRDLKNLNARAEELRLGREELLGIIKSGEDNSYQAPTEDRKITVLAGPVPSYTEEARRNHVSGTIVVEVQFLADGRLANAHALNSLGFGLDQDALKSAYRIVFIPAIEGGHFKDSIQKVKVSYSQV